MQIFAKSIDDFKSDRKDISPPLPIYLRILPVVFYLTVLATILLNGLFFLNLSQASKNKDLAVARDRQIQADLVAAKKERGDLEDEAKKASDILAWMDAARPLQPLMVEIARSIEPDSSILELRMDRDAENPTQIRFALRLSSETTRQLDLTLAKISDLRFRTFSPQQSLNKGEIDYKATLLWLDAGARDQKEPQPAGS